MPERRLAFKPGIDIESTATSSRGGFNASNLIRWRYADGSVWAEKLGGWQHVTTEPMSGICRALNYWADLHSQIWIGAGTNLKLYVENVGTLYDITPTGGFTPGAPSSGAIPFSLHLWSQDHFGQVGMFNPSKQGLFAWTPPILPNPADPAILVATAPPENQGMVVTMPQQIVMTYGSSPDSGQLDPMLIRWSDASNYTVWDPTTTNQAGSFRLSTGTRIVGALQSNLATYIWTDLGLWTAQYTGFPLIFGFFQQGTSCGLIGQKAATTLGTTTYWMSEHGFFLTTGSGFQQIPCPVWDYVYMDLDTANQDKCVAGADYHYNEVFFFFPSKSGGTGEIDSYVKFNVMLNLWDVGRLERTAWIDFNEPGPPIAVDAAGIMQQHDTGYDADGAAMTGVSLTTGYLDLADGSEMLLIKRLIPDFVWAGNTPSLTVSALVRSFAGDSPVTCGPFMITPQTEYVSLGKLTPFPILGVRGREVALQIECDALSSWFRMGTSRMLVAPDGRL